MEFSNWSGGGVVLLWLVAVVPFVTAGLSVSVVGVSVVSVSVLISAVGASVEEINYKDGTYVTK